MTFSKPLLRYHNYRGLMQPVRHILGYLNIDFQDIKNNPNLSNSDNNLGYEDGVFKKSVQRHDQLSEIMVHVAEKRPELKLKPLEAKGAIKIQKTSIELMKAISDFCFEPNPRYNPDYFFLLGKLSELLQDKEWCLENRLTYVDFVVYEALFWHHKLLSTEQWQKYHSAPPDSRNFLISVNFMKNFESEVIKENIRSKYKNLPCLDPASEIPI